VIQRLRGRSQVNQTLTKIGIIAIVDDDEPLREALGSVLKAAGFLIDTFASAEEFLASQLRQEIACLILDVRLPGMSGIELQRRLSETGCTIPIIFVTAHGDASLRDMLLKAGAASFLNKPVRSDTLLREIHRALDKTASQNHP
jgi:two-component system, LuxR family, response regulator FixJ